jgi:hypothetical protein
MGMNPFRFVKYVLVVAMILILLLACRGSSSRRVLVVLLAQTRALKHTFESLDRYLLSPENADLALCVSGEQKLPWHIVTKKEKRKKVLLVLSYRKRV